MIQWRAAHGPRATVDTAQQSTSIAAFPHQDSRIRKRWPSTGTGNRLSKSRSPTSVTDIPAAPALRAYLKLYRAASTITAKLALALSRECNLTMTQFNVLETLYSKGEIKQQDLGKKVLKSDGNITVVLVNLEKMGLLQRTRAEGARRDLVVSLTDEGRQRIRKAFPLFAEIVSSHMGVLSEEEMACLGEMCRRVGLQVQISKRQKFT